MLGVSNASLQFKDTPTLFHHTQLNSGKQKEKLSRGCVGVKSGSEVSCHDTAAKGFLLSLLCDLYLEDLLRGQRVKEGSVAVYPRKPPEQLTAAVSLLSWDSTHPDKLPWSRAGTTMLQLTGNWIPYVLLHGLSVDRLLVRRDQAINSTTRPEGSTLFFFS